MARAVDQRVWSLKPRSQTCVTDKWKDPLGGTYQLLTLPSDGPPAISRPRPMHTISLRHSIRRARRILLNVRVRYRFLDVPTQPLVSKQYLLCALACLLLNLELQMYPRMSKGTDLSSWTVNLAGQAVYQLY